MPGQLGGAPVCPACSDPVYFNEQRGFMGHTWHKKCFSCGHCKMIMDSTIANLVADGTVLCNKCYRMMIRDEKPHKSTEYVNHEDGECCPRCGKRVYFAEQVLSLGRKWHIMCFNCAACQKRVDSSTSADHDGELFCRTCYSRQFGPKGYGFAGGAGTLLSMDTGRAYEVTRENVPQTLQAYMIPDVSDESTVANGNSCRTQWDGGDYCPRCYKQVFIAEKRQAAGNVYHERCFTCYQCRKKLDSKLTEKDGEAYCNVCYGKKFGPEGYGFGVGAGTLQSTQ